MLGTIVNTIAIIAGSLIGLLLKNGLSDRFKTIITQAIGLTALFIGLSGSIGKLILPEAHPILFIISLVIGGIVGEALKIDKRLEKLGEVLDNKFGGGGKVSKGFMNANFLFCIGAMAIIGALESGISGNHQTLFAKSVMDGITSIIFASTYGIGVMLSSITVFIYQGAITIFSTSIGKFLNDDMIREFSLVGNILVFCIGLDVLGIKKLKVENFVPALLVPFCYYFIIGLI